MRTEVSLLSSSQLHRKYAEAPIMKSRVRTVAIALLLVVGTAVSVRLDSTRLIAKSGVRLALVNVPDELLRPLLPAFQMQTGIRAEIVYIGSDPFAVAREGKADLVISHYGHDGVRPFVSEGVGMWPHPVFANQMALLGPPSDPAHVRGLNDASEALRRIAATKSRFVVNNSAGAKYLEEMFWAGRDPPAKGDWYLDLKSQGPQAARDAGERGAYVLWGLPPFL